MNKHFIVTIVKKGDQACLGLSIISKFAENPVVQGGDAEQRS